MIKKFFYVYKNFISSTVFSFMDTFFYFFFVLQILIYIIIIKKGVIKYIIYIFTSYIYNVLLLSTCKCFLILNGFARNSSLIWL